MTFPTESDITALFDHCMITLFKWQYDTSFKAALAQTEHNNPFHWLLYDDVDFRSIRVTKDVDGKPMEVPLTVAEWRSMRTFCDYIKFKSLINEPIPPQDYINITADDYQKFITGPYYPLDTLFVMQYHRKLTST
jgi:hypothetical protein